MTITDLYEDAANPCHWHAIANGAPIIVVTRPGQDPIEVIEEAFGPQVLTYADKRVQEYPSTQEQLDMIYHDIDGWRELITAIKNKHPKV